LSMRIDKTRAKEIAREHGYLQYMIERYLALWGEKETLDFIQSCEKPIRTAIRVNTLKTDESSLLKVLSEKGIALEHVEWLDDGFYADFRSYSPGSLFEHMMGHYYVQGVPSMTVVEALDPQPGEIVVDLAAAPGGKTTHLAQKMKNNGLLLAIESDRQRIASLESNIMRCGATNTMVMRGDARKINNLGIKPDRILLDAPCSGEGLIALDPERKTSKSMADIRYCATRQDEMIESALDALNVGGNLLYSTCSIAPEENEFVIDAILRKRNDVKIVSIAKEFGIPAYTRPYGVKLDDSLSKARRFLPQKHGLEGFFICRLLKEGR
jgi:NOL1/NOP2/sun family putative RNA methylase